MDFEQYREFLRSGTLNRGFAARVEKSFQTPPDTPENDLRQVEWYSLAIKEEVSLCLKFFLQLLPVLIDGFD